MEWTISGTCCSTTLLLETVENEIKHMTVTTSACTVSYQMLSRHTYGQYLITGWSYVAVTMSSAQNFCPYSLLNVAKIAVNLDARFSSQNAPNSTFRRRSSPHCSRADSWILGDGGEDKYGKGKGERQEMLGKWMNWYMQLALRQCSYAFCEFIVYNGLTAD